MGSNRSGVTGDRGTCDTCATGAVGIDVAGDAWYVVWCAGGERLRGAYAALASDVAKLEASGGVSCCGDGSCCVASVGVDTDARAATAAGEGGDGGDDGADGAGVEDGDEWNDRSGANAGAAGDGGEGGAIRAAVEYDDES